MHIIKVSFGVFLAILSIEGDGQVGWERFVSWEGRFEIRTPGQLSKHEEKIATALGEQVYHTYFFQPAEAEPEDNLVYMVSYCDYPEGTFHPDSAAVIRALFEETVAAAVESVKGELLYQAEAELQGRPGHIWRIHFQDDQVVIKSRAYLDKDRYYAVQTVMAREFSLHPASDAFLDSFRILE